MCFVVLGHRAGVLHASVDISAKKLFPVVFHEKLACLVVATKLEATQVVDCPFVQVGGLDECYVNSQVPVHCRTLDTKHNTKGDGSPGRVLSATIETCAIVLLGSQFLEHFRGLFLGTKYFAGFVAHLYFLFKRAIECMRQGSRDPQLL